jgi:hypothetical protein
MTPDGLVTPDLVPILLANPKFDLGISREQLEELIVSREPVTYASFVTRLFDLYGEQRGKRLVGDKTPGYVRKIAMLHSLWPKAKFVHLIRDGRDVCLSALNWKRKPGNYAKRFPTWPENPVITAALWWKWHVRLGREAGSRLGPELYYEMRYESLVHDPEDECAALCAFLGVPYDGALLRFHEGRTKTGPGLSAKKAWLPLTPGLRDWSSQMPAVDLERIEAAAGDLLEELGYPRGVSHPRPETVALTASICQAFSCKYQAKLPEHW